jgi:hypothetical protein
MQTVNTFQNRLLLKLCTNASGSVIVGGIFLKESFGKLLKCFVVFPVNVSMSSNLFPFRDNLRLGNNRNHKKPCQEGRVVAEPQEFHDFLKKKKNLNTVGFVRGCIFVMQSPQARFPFLWPLATNGESQSLQNRNTVKLIHCLILGT